MVCAGCHVLTFSYVNYIILKSRQNEIFKFLWYNAKT